METILLSLLHLKAEQNEERDENANESQIKEEENSHFQRYTTDNVATSSASDSLITENENSSYLYVNVEDYFEVKEEDINYLDVNIKHETSLLNSIKQENIDNILEQIDHSQPKPCDQNINIAIYGKSVAEENNDSKICQIDEENVEDIQKEDKTVETNLGERTFEVRFDKKSCTCNICGKSFRVKQNLVIHSRTHKRKTPHLCETCGNVVIFQSALVYHFRKHTGEKPFSCNTCGISFNQRSNIKTHLRLHMAKKPYFCNICCKSFTRKIVLENHSRIHTSEIPFSCNTCGKRFRQKSYLVKHFSKHASK